MPNAFDVHNSQNEFQSPVLQNIGGPKRAVSNLRFKITHRSRVQRRLTSTKINSGVMTI